MPSTLLLSLGFALAQQLVKTLLNGHPLTDFAANLAGVAKDEALAALKDKKRGPELHRIAEGVVAGVARVSKAEAAQLDEGGRQSVVLAVAEVLARANLSAELLVDLGFSSSALSARLRQVNPQAARLFSAGESALFERLIDELSPRIIFAAAEFPDFEVAVPKATLAILAAYQAKFDDLRDLLKELAEQRARAAALPPFEAPPRAAPFTGRQDDLAWLERALQPGQTVSLTGPGGIGKSALTAEALHRLRDAGELARRFPGGVILYNFYRQPSLQLACDHIARACGVDPNPDPLPAARRALGARQALLVLEGAEEAGDLSPLLGLPGRGGLLLNTRSPQQAVGEIRELEYLDDPDALLLLQGYAGSYAADPAPSAELAKRLAGWPLALRLAGQRLKATKQSAARFLERYGADLLTALDRGAHRQESLPVLLQGSLAQVPELARRALALAGRLGLHLFGSQPLAYALEQPVEALDAALDDLVSFGLLDRQDERLLFPHALVYGFARRLPLAAPALPRLADWFAGWFEEGASQGAAAFPRLELERPHLLPLLHACQEAPDLPALIRLADGAHAYLELSGRWLERRQAQASGLEAARALPDRQAQARFLTHLGLACADLGEPRRAIELYEQALLIHREIGDRRGEGNALGSLGIAYKNLGEPYRAIEFYEQQLVITRQVGDRRGEGGALGNLGLAYTTMGEPRRAIMLYEQALLIAREIGDRRVEGNALGSLGLAYADLDESRRAIELYEQHLIITREVGDRRGEGNSLGSLGNAYAVLDEPRRAIELYEQHLIITREIGDRRGAGAALGNLGSAYFSLGEPRRAIELYEQALLIDRGIGDRRGEGITLGNLGIAYAALDEPRRAIEHYEQQLVITRQIGDLMGEAAACYNLAVGYLALDQPAQALPQARQAAALFARIGHPGYTAQAQALVGHLEGDAQTPPAPSPDEAV